MKRRYWLAGAAGVTALILGGIFLWRGRKPTPISKEELAARYAPPLSAPERGLRVYHLGHSLVGRDMPAMLEQLAHAAGFADHRYESQLGWGTSLKQHWEPDEEIFGFDRENDHPRFRPAREAVASGDYDAVILTEMVEIRDAIRYHDSARYLARWAAAIGQGNPDTRTYLYETWHQLDDPEGWETRVQKDLARYWEGEILRPAMAPEGIGTIWTIPGGQVLAAVIEAAEAGKIPGLTDRTDFFARNPEGELDQIHINEIGSQVIALAHFSTLYHRSGEGLPYRLNRADGSPATPLPDAASAEIQRLVWTVVSGYAATGIGTGT
ncbi:MAG: hypothetical protein ACK5M4_15670 [Pseudorhodobacter sp.]